MKHMILMFILLFPFIGCSDSQNNFWQKTPIEFTTIGKGELHGNREEDIQEQNIVISDTESWIELMEQMNSSNNVTESFTETNIDFSSFMVIAVFDEIQQYGGYSISITDVVENKNDIIVSVENKSEGGINPVVNQPFHIVKIPITII